MDADEALLIAERSIASLESLEALKLGDVAKLRELGRLEGFRGRRGGDDDDADDDAAALRVLSSGDPEALFRARSTLASEAVALVRTLLRERAEARLLDDILTADSAKKPSSDRDRSDIRANTRLTARLQEATLEARAELRRRQEKQRLSLLEEHEDEEEGEDATAATGLRRRRGGGRASTSKSDYAASRAEAEHEAAREVTDTMRTLRQRMAAQVEQSSSTIDELSKGSALIDSTLSQHDTLGQSIAHGGALLSRLRRRELTDRVLVYMAFGFFNLTILYIVKTRLGISFFWS